MSENKENSTFKTVLEFGPILVFFLSYKFAPISKTGDTDIDLDKIIFATKVFIPTIFIFLLIGWLRTKELAKMPLFSAIIILVFGGLTIWLRDETFIKMKPTIIYLFFSGILGFGLLRGKSYLKSLLGSALPMTNEGWLILTRRFTLFFLLLAFCNEIIWRYFSTDLWVNFKTFGLPLAVFLFFFLQARLIQTFKKDN